MLVSAQDVVWQEERTVNFAILYPEGAEAQAQQYTAFVDEVYDEISGVFGYRTATPVVLRIYPTMDLYYQANPQAEQLPGVVAHAHTGRREISIALPQTAEQSDEQIVNNVRHELAHIIATDLSNNKLAAAFQEGIAQYVEHPTPELDTKMQMLQRAIAEGRLLDWSTINQPGVAYSDPQLTYPQSYSMVAFLIDRNGFATLRQFVEASRSSNGHRSALETAYGVSADRLEQEWRAQLDQFVAGGYRAQAVATFDSAHAEGLIARGEYTEAVRELETIRAGLAADSDEIVMVDALLERARSGQQATQLATEARRALVRGDYEAAMEAAETAGPMLAALGQPAQAKVLGEYAQLAAEGMRAEQQLDLARRALRTLQVNTARTALVDAYTSFTKLGDQDGADAAYRALSTIERTQWLFVISLLLLAAVTVGWNVHRRVSERTPVTPFS